MCFTTIKTIKYKNQRIFANKYPALPSIQIASLSPSSIVSLELSQVEWMAGGEGEDSWLAWKQTGLSQEMCNFLMFCVLEGSRVRSRGRNLLTAW